VGHRTGLDGCGKSRPPPGFDAKTLQPLATVLPRGYGISRSVEYKNLHKVEELNEELKYTSLLIDMKCGT
jgi:hypothetical protein